MVAVVVAAYLVAAMLLAHAAEVAAEEARRILMLVQHWVLGGGGPKGFAHIGVMQQLARVSRVPWSTVVGNMRTVTGVSAGTKYVKKI